MFLLDRNAVDCIKDANAGREQTDQKKRDFLAKLKSLDQESSHISPLLSIIEGERGREDSSEEKAACVAKEATALSDFYKKARTDSGFLLLQAQLAGQTFSENRETGWEARERFLDFVCPLLGGGVAKAKRARLERQFIDEARNIGIALGDPTFMLAVAALYGGQAARKVLKPTAPNVYNTLSDIHLISRVGYILALAQNMGARLTIEVVTLDMGLDTVLRGIMRDNQTLREDGTLNQQVRYSPSLFEDLSEDEAIRVMERVLAAGH